MIESSAERSGQNPLTQTPIVASTSTNPLANAINGHEQHIPNLDDLQFACTFPLPSAKPCASGDPACDCAPDKMGNSDAVQVSNSPLCQPPTGGRNDDHAILWQGLSRHARAEVRSAARGARGASLDLPEDTHGHEQS